MMKGVKPVVLLGALLLSETTFAQGNGADSPVALELSRDGNSATVLLRATGEDVFLPACRGVAWERFSPSADGGAGVYVTLSEEPCDAEKPPIKVSKDGVEFRAPITVRRESAVLRVVAVVGLGCSEDRPMAVGGCRSLHPVTSTNLTITADDG